MQPSLATEHELYSGYSIFTKLYAFYFILISNLEENYPEVLQFYCLEALFIIY